MPYFTNNLKDTRIPNQLPPKVLHSAYYKYVATIFVLVKGGDHVDDEDKVEEEKGGFRGSETTTTTTRDGDGW